MCLLVPPVVEFVLPPTFIQPNQWNELLGSPRGTSRLALRKALACLSSGGPPPRPAETELSSFLHRARALPGSITPQMQAVWPRGYARTSVAVGGGCGLVPSAVSTRIPVWEAFVWLLVRLVLLLKPRIRVLQKGILQPIFARDEKWGCCLWEAGHLLPSAKALIKSLFSQSLCTHVLTWKGCWVRKSWDREGTKGKPQKVKSTD